MAHYKGHRPTYNFTIWTLPISTTPFEEQTTWLYQNTTTDQCDYRTPEDVYQLGVPLKVVFGIFIGIMVLISTLGNCIVCLIVYQKPVMRSAINILLANMAFTNILLAVVCMPFALVTLIIGNWIFGDYICRTIAFIHSCLVCEGSATLLLISLDRYLIVVLRKDKLNTHRAKICIVLSWIVSIILTFPPTVGWGAYKYYSGWIQCILKEYNTQEDLAYVLLYFILIFFIPMSIMGLAFIAILNRVRNNSRKIYIASDSERTGQVHIGNSLNVSQARIGVDMSFKTRAFKTIFLLFLIHLTCWAPYAIAMLVWNVSHALKGKALFGNVVLWVGYMQCAINPLVYCIRIKKFREACREIIPQSTKFLPILSVRTKRRINPASVYEANDYSYPSF